MTNHISVLNDVIGSENGNRARAALRLAGYVIYKGDPSAEIGRLETAIKVVVSAFEKDEAQGYQSKDRQFAIEILKMALQRS